MNRFRTFESLRVRDFRLLWLGQLNGGLGLWMDQLARTYLIYTLTGSALQLGLVAALRGVPLLVFGMVAGVVADRFSRKLTMMFSLGANSFLCLLLAVLVVTGHIQPWHVYVTAFLAGTAHAFQQPARMALINDLVGPERLMNAVALNSAVLNLSRGFGPAVSGLIIGSVGVSGSYFAEAVLYLLALVWTAQIRLPPRAAGGAKRPALTAEGFFRETGESLRYVARHRLLLPLMVLALAPVMLGMPFTSLMPIFALDILKVGSTGQGLLLSAVGVGAVVGALTMATIGKARGSLLVLGAALFGLSLVGFSRSPVLGLALFFTFLAGVFNGSYNSQNQTMIQLLAPQEMRGRVVSIYLMDRGLMPIGTLGAAALAQYLGGPNAVTIMGVACALVALGVGVASPALRRLSMAPQGAGGTL